MLVADRLFEFVRHVMRLRANPKREIAYRISRSQIRKNTKRKETTDMRAEKGSSDVEYGNQATKKRESKGSRYLQHIWRWEA